MPKGGNRNGNGNGNIDNSQRLNDYLTIYFFSLFFHFTVIFQCLECIWNYIWGLLVLCYEDTGSSSLCSRTIAGEPTLGDNYVQVDSETQIYCENTGGLLNEECETTKDVNHLKILHQGTTNNRSTKLQLMCFHIYTSQCYSFQIPTRRSGDNF